MPKLASLFGLLVLAGLVPPALAGDVHKAARPINDVLSKGR